MKAKKLTAITSLMCLALGACSTDSTTMSKTGEPYSSANGMPSTMTPSAAASDTARQASTAVYGVVQAIDTIPRSQAGDMMGSQDSTSSQSGTSGTAGSTGSANDMVYRITLKLDDGTTRSVSQEGQPAYQTGDRVRLNNGMIQRY